jgi:ubiquinone/menaquinone biosynthesis C-methylase UbiE
MLDELRQLEKAKYDRMYNDPEGGYGHKYCGRKAIPILKEYEVKSCLDVGCGDNKFAIDLRNSGIVAIGIDFSCPDADIVAPAHQLPFPDKSFHWVTSFDMLEHLLPEEVDQVFAEFARVAIVGWCFSISFRESKFRYKDEQIPLHPTIQPKEWWIEKIRQYIPNVLERKKYIYGVLK